jgi:hypothetical protein
MNTPKELSLLQSKFDAAFEAILISAITRRFVDNADAKYYINLHRIDRQAVVELVK